MPQTRDNLRADLIRERMDELRLTVRGLAKKVGRTHTCVQHWRTRGRVSNNDLDVLAQQLKIDPIELQFPDHRPTDLDIELLVKVVAIIIELCDVLNIKLTPEKMAAVTVQLYELSKDSGEINKNIARSLVNLAA